MALADILAHLNEETIKQIEKLEKAFEEKIKKLEKEYENKQKEIDTLMNKKVEEKSREILEKAKSLAERESKNKLLKAKRSLINEAIEEAITELANSDNYEEIIVTMLKKVKLNDDNVVIIPARKKEEETKKAIQKSDQKFFISEKSADIKGGFIVKTEKIEIDNSFEIIFGKVLREDLEINLNKLFF